MVKRYVAQMEHSVKKLVSAVKGKLSHATMDLDVAKNVGLMKIIPLRAIKETGV